jgi:hypothetical protein
MVIVKILYDLQLSYNMWDMVNPTKADYGKTNNICQGLNNKFQTRIRNKHLNIDICSIHTCKYQLYIISCKCMHAYI